MRVVTGVPGRERSGRISCRLDLIRFCGRFARHWSVVAYGVHGTLVHASRRTRIASPPCWAVRSTRFSMITLDAQSLHALATNGCGFSRKQVEAFGISYPPKKGWVTRLIGTEISEEKYEQILQLNRQLVRARNREINGQPKPILTPDELRAEVAEKVGAAYDCDQQLFIVSVDKVHLLSRALRKKKM